MKKLLIILGIVVVIVLILIGILVYKESETTQSEQAPSITATTFPIGSASGTPAPQNAISVASQTGTQIQTNDFIKNGITAEDPENKGNYYLAGSLGYCLSNGQCPSGASSTEYTIVYFSQDKSFIISLTSEPLGQARIDAEAFLQKELGISSQDMCNLKYSVMTTASVNSQYAGQNLGFSYCTGAVKLP